MNMAQWVRNHPDEARDILAIARSQSPVSRDRTLIALAQRRGLPVKANNRDRPVGPDVGTLRQHITGVLNLHPELFEPWSSGRGGSSGDRYWLNLERLQLQGVEA